MEKNAFSETVDKLHKVIVKVSENKDNEKLMDWLKKACAPEKELIEALFENFMEVVEEAEQSTKLLMILKKLNELLPDVVLPQMQVSKKFPKAISHYIEVTDPQRMTGDALVLLVNLYSTSSFKEVTDVAFVKALFDVFEFIIEEDFFRALVSILVSVHYESTTRPDSIVMQQVREHPSALYFKETLFQLLNMGSYDKAKQCLQLFVDIFAHKDLANNFHHNDLNMLLIIIEREVINESAKHLRRGYLRLLKLVLKTDWYQKERIKEEDLIGLLHSLRHDEEADEFLIKEAESILKEQFPAEID